MPSVAVVILNYNGKHWLETFLPGVVRHSPDSQIVVADNRSTDGSVAYVRAHFPTVHIIELARNEGYSRGYNLALEQIDADYYVLLNSDVEVTPGWLPPLITLMDENPVIAACQPKIKSYAQRDWYEYAGGAGGFIDQWGYPFCRGRIFQDVEADTGQYDDTREIFWASGSCLVLRANAFHEVYGLDDHFFAHMEEIDLCWRLKNRGYQIYYCSASEVYHVGGGTLTQVNPQKTYLNFRNGLFMLYKNLPDKNLRRTLFIRLVLDGVAAIRFLAGGRTAHFFAVFRAHISFYRNYSAWRPFRNASRALNAAAMPPQMYRRSIVYDYYLRGKKKFTDLSF